MTALIITVTVASLVAVSIHYYQKYKAIEEVIQEQNNLLRKLNGNIAK